MSHHNHTESQDLILALLTEHGPLTPQQLAERGGPSLAKGGVYVALTALRQAGEVSTLVDGTCWLSSLCAGSVA